MREMGAVRALTLALALGVSAASIVEVRTEAVAVPVFATRQVATRPEAVLDSVERDARVLVKRYAKGDRTRMAVDFVTSAEVASLGSARSTLLGSRPDYTSPRLGFSIRGAQNSAALYSIDRQIRNRVISMGGLSARLETTQLHTAWGLQARATSALKVPTVTGVARAIESMALPDQSLAGVTIFIVPFSLESTSGLSWPGVIALGSRPLGYRSIDTQLEFTVAHEVGHILHYRYMGPADSGAWREYMRIRRIPKWLDGGQALTAAWESSVEESFAEDVRVVLGGPASAEAEHGTVYGDPRDTRGLVSGLNRFFGARFGSGHGTGGEGGAPDVFAGASCDLI